MGKVTALRTRKGIRKWVNVFLDGKFAFSLDAGLASREGLAVDHVLSAERVERLVKANGLKRCFDAATRYLGYRPRSEAELRERLSRLGFDGYTRDAVIAGLKEQGLVDDTAFAQFWKDNRQSFSPRSRRLTRLELKTKGVAEDVIDEAVRTLDDDENAYQAALSRARRLSRFDYQSFRRRLGEYLRRRGFSYDVIGHTIRRVWQEHGGGGQREAGGDCSSAASSEGEVA